MYQLIYNALEEGFYREGVTEIPPDDLIASVIGTGDKNFFQETGKSTYLDLTLILAKYFDKTWTDFNKILDFGVGCGRTCRFIPTKALTNLHGIDTNKNAINWCNNNLIGSFETNDYAPPTNFKDDTFDLIYSFSVFSHMKNEDAIAWIKELHRITRKDGILLITAHLSWASKNLLEKNEYNKLLEDGFFYRKYQAEGKNQHNLDKYINVFMNERHFWNLWKDHFQLIAITSGKDAKENIPKDWKFEIPKTPTGQGIGIFIKK